MVVVPTTITLLDVVLVLAVVVSTETVGTIVVVVLTAVIGSAVAVAIVVVTAVVVLTVAVVIVVVDAVVVLAVVVVEGAVVVKTTSDSPQAENKRSIGNNNPKKYFLLTGFIKFHLVLQDINTMKYHLTCDVASRSRMYCRSRYTLIYGSPLFTKLGITVFEKSRFSSIYYGSDKKCHTVFQKFSKFLSAKTTKERITTLRVMRS